MRFVWENKKAIRVGEADLACGWWCSQSFTQLSTSKSGYATYQLSLTLASTSQNVYALFGTEDQLADFPPALQVRRSISIAASTSSSHAARCLPPAQAG